MSEQSENSAPPVQAPDFAASAPIPPAEVNPAGQIAPNGSAGPTSRIEALEAELADWQRRAVVWRERALSTQALNDALTSNLEDLRTLLDLRASREAAAVERAATEQWWTKVFRRETWVTGR
jgi:hypothetical protein